MRIHVAAPRCERKIVGHVVKEETVENIKENRKRPKGRELVESTEKCLQKQLWYGEVAFSGTSCQKDAPDAEAKIEMSRKLTPEQVKLAKNILHKRFEALLRAQAEEEKGDIDWERISNLIRNTWASGFNYVRIIDIEACLAIRITRAQRESIKSRLVSLGAEIEVGGFICRNDFRIDELE
jgi:hypothetical protein